MGEYVRRDRGSHCRDEHRDEYKFRDKPDGIWRCSCGKAWRVFMGMPQWRVRRHDAAVMT